jgi:hypothetical protein
LFRDCDMTPRKKHPIEQLLSDEFMARVKPITETLLRQQEQMQKQFALSDDLIARIQQTTEPLLLAQKKMQQQFALSDDLIAQLKPIAETLSRQQQKMQEQLAPFAEEIHRITKQFEGEAAKWQAILEPLATQFEAVQKALAGLPQQTQAQARTLAHNGWYIDPDMSPRPIADLVEQFETGRADNAHATLCAHYESRLDEVQQKLCKNHPERERLIRSAFAAHRRGDFAASIPLLLAQADGICRDITGVQLYAQDKLKSLVNDAEPIALSILVALVDPAPITANRQARKGIRGILNRHAVMHGESTDYDTALNSSRAISLLVFVEWAVGEILRSQLPARTAKNPAPKKQVGAD